MQIIFPMAWKYTEICSKTGNKFTLGIALCREKETQAESSTQQVQQNVLSFIFQARDRYLGGHYFILFFFFWIFGISDICHNNLIGKRPGHSSYETKQKLGNSS